MTGSYDQGDVYIAANSIDGLPGTGWGFFNGQTVPQTGIFITSGPVNATEIEITLQNNFGSNHYVQEFRISTTTDAAPSIGGIWTPLTPASMRSNNATTISPVAGGFARVEGLATGGRMTAALRAAGSFTGITGFLLEVNPFDYDTLDANPATIGRSANGNAVLSEFTVLTDGDINLALGRAAGFFNSAGNPVGSYGAGQSVANIVDGNINTIGHPVGTGGVSNDYYAQIDLGTELAIGYIDITGRLDLTCCDDRLENYTLKLLAADGVTEVLSLFHTGGTKETERIDIAASNNGVSPLARFIRIVNTQGTNYGPQIGEVAVFGSFTPPPPGALFQITELTTDTVNGNATLVFNSVAGRKYLIFGSSNLLNWAEVKDNITATAFSTESDFPDLDLINAPERYYKVRDVTP